MVGNLLDAVHHRITHDDMRRLHIDSGPKGSLTLGKLAGFHTLKELQVFFYRTIAERAVLSGFIEGPPVLPDLFRIEITNVGITLTNQLDRPLMKLTEVITGVMKAIPFESEPTNVILNGIDKLLFFLGRVGVIESQVATAAMVTDETEVEADRLGVTNVQKPVRLRRKSKLKACRIPPCFKIRLNQFFDKVESLLF